MNYQTNIFIFNRFVAAKVFEGFCDWNPLKPRLSKVSEGCIFQTE